MARTIIKAETCGFCFGVKNAANTAEAELAKGTSLYALGELMHNKHEMQRLHDLGLIHADSVDDIPLGSTMIIRSHGELLSTYEKLKTRGIAYIDVTCPHVKRAHEIVRKHYEMGYNIVIVGDASHPEVMGINDRCNNSALIISDNDAQDISIYYNTLHNFDKVCVVAQTTIKQENYKYITDCIKNTCQNPLIFDTICSTTQQRQNEAREISAKCDTVVVIGSKNSNNTKKLVAICTKICYNTFHIETAEDIHTIEFIGHTIGVIAGASTPDWIIKEVLTMLETNVETTNELDFAEELEKTVLTLKSGDIVKGTVISINPSEVFVDLGVKSDGAIPVSELTDDPIQSPGDVVKVGEEIEVYVVRVNDVEGTITLSKKKVDQLAGIKKLEKAFADQEILTGKVVEILKGGVIVSTNNVRVFVPASQASERYLQDLGILLNETVSFKIIDINARRRKLVGSIKSVAGEVRKQKVEQFWASASEGSKYTGTVKSITPFGVFVDIGGIDGLVHISELSWTRVKHPSELVNVGDKIDVFIIALDREKNKISLGHRREEDSPWAIAQAKLNVGDILKAKIVRLVTFGAFAEIMPHIDGLIHISQISDQRIVKPSDVLSVGQEVDVKVIELDYENKKISLSMKAAASAEPVAETEVTE